MRANRTSGFTLVEIMVVVVIIGLLATLAVPAIQRAREQSQNSRFANDMRVLVGQLETYITEVGTYPEDSTSGVIPSGFSPYIHANQWNDGPSIGGVWDVERDSYGVTLAIGVHQFTVTNEQIVKFDQKYDNGNVSTGDYRMLDGDRYYFIVAE
ncbi:MAG: type II secretion system protein [Verrucomicrobiota bacterium]